MKKERESAFIDLLTMEMNKVIVGQKHMVERLLIGLLGQGHIWKVFRISKNASY
jgi:MoxR-like ATPase